MEFAGIILINLEFASIYIVCRNFKNVNTYNKIRVKSVLQCSHTNSQLILLELTAISICLILVLVNHKVICGVTFGMIV